MEEILKLMESFEELNNLSINVKINSDGSGCLNEFWDDEEFYTFDDIDELKVFLLNGNLAKSDDGRSLSPIKIIPNK